MSLFCKSSLGSSCVVRTVSTSFSREMVILHNKCVRFPLIIFLLFLRACNLLTAPSSGVVNITVGEGDIQPTSVRLTWNPPPIRDWNGIIANYNISEC